MRKLFALLLLLGAAPAVAQDMTLTLTPQEVLAIVRTFDRQPISETPPAGYWSVQEKIVTALRDPRARAEFDRLAAEQPAPSQSVKSRKDPR